MTAALAAAKTVQSTTPAQLFFPAGLMSVTADPMGNKAGLAARAALVACRNFKAGEMQHSRFVVLAYNPQTGDVFIQHETGSSVHRVNRVTGICDCGDATKGQTKRLRLACVEGGLNPDELPATAIEADDDPTGLYCKHFWIFGAIRSALRKRCGDTAAERALCQFPTDLPRKYWTLCPSKRTEREIAR